MGSGGTRAGGIAVRLVLLALLLLGVGVLHTLSHAGAHGGVSAPAHSHEAQLADEERTGAAHATAVALVEGERDEPEHRAYAEGAAASDCFALIPVASELARPPCTAVLSGTTGPGVLTAEGAREPGGGLAPARLSVLRI
ncbi:hypothetical protein [Streptomyces sp. S.PB5]|uniref:hypothetical protein n=1 Tax=Streptomyces sp. S.PB5 TaxID=3020844 RepID=UPI0025AF6BC2|nr:hypothetical protein [Streptomyces sp. S.PB5]MDN3021405.1 hypothetical protein [Streptomyces sp. S.PB5]